MRLKDKILLILFRPATFSARYLIQKDRLEQEIFNSRMREYERSKKEDEINGRSSL